MPELPEVEKLVQGVRAASLGAQFSEVNFFRDNIREPIDKDAIRDVIVRQRIVAVTRRGKYMIIQTPKGGLGIHLGMSGRFILDDSCNVSRPHTHVVFSFEKLDGSVSYFHFIDPRRFGRVFATLPGEENQKSHRFFKNLGREPLEDPGTLGKHLFEVSRKRRVPLKTFIMDNAFIVGVGNIYASEALWRAKLSPTRLALELSMPEAKRLAREIVSTLNEAIAAGGTTFKDYRNSDDKPGSYQVKLAVYEQNTKGCRRCRGLIAKITQAGRSTYFCSVCQK